MIQGQAYPAELCAKLEQAYQAGNQTVDLDDSHARYVNIQAMQQIRYDDGSKWRHVRRAPGDG